MYRTAIYSFIIFFPEYDCTRSSGPLLHGVIEIKAERIKSCTHHSIANIGKKSKVVT